MAEHNSPPDTLSATLPTDEAREESDQPLPAQIHAPPSQHMTTSIGDTDTTNDSWETDSALGFSTAPSYTASLTESVLDYEYENGRRYHSYRSGIYPLPNDEPEQDRMDMQHHIYLLLLGGELYTAPLKPDIQRVLDIGTGTGIWAIDMADKFPNAEVIATDLSVIQPQWVPPNLQFEIDDCELEWTYSKKFDYIHIRSMSGSIGDWPALMRRAYENLNPGGWLEVTDYETQAQADDGSVPPNSAWVLYQDSLNEAASKFGKLMNAAPHYYEYVLSAGFANVTERVEKVPFSTWPDDPKKKELGRWMVPQMLASVEPYGLALLSRVLGWDIARIQVLLAGVRSDIRNVHYHLYSKCHIVLGQKPSS